MDIFTSAGGVLINGEGKIFLTRKIERNEWSLPKGGQEDGESLIDTAKREIEEETGFRNIELVSDEQIGHNYFELSDCSRRVKMSEEYGGAKVVVIGGGTGSFTLLSGLRKYVSDLTSLVNMADDGGSTGQLRDELGVLPPGDVRQCLVALSDSPRVRDLFNYRFDDGSLKGHAFGNLFLTALEKMTGSFGEAVQLASQVLNIQGRVIPTTLTDITLCVEDASGETIKGEFKIAHANIAKRPKVWLEPEAVAHPAAVQAILEADMVVIAPGNLYGSLAPALVIREIQEALAATSAKCVFVCNLVTKPGPTDNLSVVDFASEIERLAGSEFLDYVVFNTDQPSAELMDKYAHDGEHVVQYDISELKRQHYEFRGASILAKKVWSGAQSSDPIAAVRSFIRHDPDAVARQLMRIYFA